MPHGGKRAGAGRPKGAKSKRTVEREQAVQRAAEQLAGVIDDPFEGDAHAFLMSIYKDPAQPIDLRLDAAKAAAPYEKPKLASTDLNASVKVGSLLDVLNGLD